MSGGRPTAEPAGGVRGLAKTVVTAARRAGLDEQDPLWPLLMALVALAIGIDHRTRPFGLWARLTRPRSPDVWIGVVLLGLAGSCGISAFAFSAGVAHGRAAVEATIPHLAMAYARSGDAGAKAWSDLMQANDPAALAGCDPVAADTGVPGWRWCRVTLRVPTKP